MKLKSRSAVLQFTGLCETVGIKLQMDRNYALIILSSSQPSPFVSEWFAARRLESRIPCLFAKELVDSFNGFFQNATAATG